MGGFRISIGGLSILMWFAAVLPGAAVVPKWVETVTVWSSPELRSLDGEIQMIESELKGLPNPAGTNTGIRRGFQTGRAREGEDLWVDLTLAKPTVVDQIIMVPMLGKGAHGDVKGFGFPQRFQLEARGEDGEVYLLMDETADDFPNPGLYPVMADCPPGVKIAGIRLIATEPWTRGGPRVLALAEIMALRGNRNLAAGAKVRSSSSRELRPTWSGTNLLDMATPLGLPVAPPPGSVLGWHGEVSSTNDVRKKLTVDLGRIYELDELRLAPVWRPGMLGSFNYGFPSRYAIETACSADFSDRRVIVDRTDQTAELPGQNLQCYELGAMPVRYIRIIATRMRERAGDYVFALGELQAYVGDENVAPGATVVSEESIENAEWGQAALTDGLTGAGKLLELPEWLQGLERRRVLEERLTEIRIRRADLLERGEQWLVNGSIGTTIGLGIAGVFLAWRSKRLRRLDRERHRERLARDLHDELGSNLGSIALISSFALEGESDEKQMRGDMAEIELVARESADSMRDLVELLGGRHRGAGGDWLGVLRGLAERMTRGMELDCRLAEEPLTMEPDLESRREIYLFCKEVLHNIVRHAGASKVGFLLRENSGGLRVEINDDGSGFIVAEAKEGHGLRNLRERAAGLNAEMDLASVSGKGTLVTLNVPQGRRWRKPKPDRTR